MNTYFYYALTKIKPKTDLPSTNLWDWFAKNDERLIKGRFLTKPVLDSIEKENLDSLYTNRTVTCPKCGKNETARDTKQTRKGDEGETVFYECKYCKAKFRG